MAIKLADRRNWCGRRVANGRRARALAKVVTLPLVLAISVVSLTGCSASPSSHSSISQTLPSYKPHTGKIRVVASVAVWADIAQTIGGEAVSASAIVSSANQDPHSYEATVRNQLSVNQADLTITNGADYDQFFAKLVANKPSRTHGIQLVLASHIDQKTPSPNPHLWYDLGYVRQLTGVIGAAEAAAAPSHQTEAQIHARTLSFQASIDTLIAHQRRVARATVGKGALLTEGFALRMLRNLAIIDSAPREFRLAVEQGQDASPATMATMRNLMSHHRVQLLILNGQTQGAQTNQLTSWAKERRIPVLKLSEVLPPGQHYLSWMSDNLTRIESALQ